MPEWCCYCDNSQPLSVVARNLVCWLWSRPDHPLPVHTLRHPDNDVRRSIVSNGGSRQARTKWLFFDVQNVVIWRATVGVPGYALVIVGSSA